ncbi:MAG: M15 family metallopeptidase [Flavobacteriaceae bacterium]
MKRRSFIKNTGLSAFAVGMVPQLTFSQEREYSIEELMGKANIELVGEDVKLGKEALDAFLQMKKAAYSDGIDLKIVSGYRSFDRQMQIWERKYIRYTEDDGMRPLNAIEKIIEYSTIPGTSRHHWGTDIDIVDGYRKVKGDVLVPEKFEGEGPYADFKKWMDENANDFGYYLVYTDEPKRRGFKYEPWHYSYAPVSRPMLEAFRSKNILSLLSKEDFMGVEHFTTHFLRGYIQNNILGINEALL